VISLFSNFFDESAGVRRIAIPGSYMTRVNSLKLSPLLSWRRMPQRGDHLEFGYWSLGFGAFDL
jgi:hypothetical protein